MEWFTSWQGLTSIERVRTWKPTKGFDFLFGGPLIYGYPLLTIMDITAPIVKTSMKNLVKW